MLQFLLDTDHVTLFERGHAPLRQQLAAQTPGAVAVSAVTIWESLRGRLAAVNRHRFGPPQVMAFSNLVSTVRMFQDFPIAPYDHPADQRIQQLSTSHRRLNAQDLKIAAVALVHGLTLVTRNRRDFGGIGGLVLADWSI